MAEAENAVFKVIVGIIFTAIGVAISKWGARYISKKQFHGWKKTIEATKLEEKIRTDVRFAVMVFCTHPCKMSLNYITWLNPEAGAYIVSQLQGNKKVKWL